MPRPRYKQSDVNIRADHENKKVYVIGRDIDLFISLLVSGLYSHQGYEVIYETKEEKK